jgi:two-component system, chemotaxis family, protein-glutamate methylesterase/glutaminase
MDDIQRQHLYVARPDHHLTIENGKVRVLRGPRENRYRPAIDPLFRTAAREYGPRVVGIILSGLQDDGSAGLYAVKQRGGIAIVQDPSDAMWKDMPARAMEYADPDYVLPAQDIAPRILDLANAQEVEPAMARKNSIQQKSNGRNQRRNEKRESNSSGALEPPDVNVNEDVAYSEEGEGVPSVFACPSATACSGNSRTIR